MAPANTHAEILLVEDEAMLRTAIQRILRAQGYSVAALGDGTALEEYLASGASPRLLLLDLCVPRLDLATVRRAQRPGGPLASTTLLVMSGLDEAPHAASALGAAGCLLKPFDLSELLGAVARFGRTRTSLRPPTL
ncbi:MAG: response regulator [Deltaproteobacteria bacterium]|nr:response regulator [Deltaproteobacteria bacterium]